MLGNKHVTELFRPSTSFGTSTITKTVKKFEKKTNTFWFLYCFKCTLFASEALFTTLMLLDDKCQMPIKCSSDTFDLDKNTSDESEPGPSPGSAQDKPYLLSSGLNFYCFL